MTENHYTKLAAIDCGGKIEKKNGLSYLSWAWAVDQLLRADPMAVWAYNEPTTWGETVMVSCTITAFGVARTMQLPVMDHRNKAIAKPDAFAVNTAMQRCLVKAIALHGIGLYIYAGEDLPPNEDGETVGEENARVAAEKKAKPEPKSISPTAGVRDGLTETEQQFFREHAEEISAFIERGLAADAVAYVQAQGFTAEEFTTVWTYMSAPIRSKYKAAKSLATANKDA